MHNCLTQLIHKKYFCIKLTVRAQNKCKCEKVNKKKQKHNLNNILPSLISLCEHLLCQNKTKRKVPQYIEFQSHFRKLRE